MLIGNDMKLEDDEVVDSEFGHVFSRITVTNAEKSNEFGRAVHYCELVNAVHPHLIDWEEDPAETANNMLKLYELRWNSKEFKYEVFTKEQS